MAALPGRFNSTTDGARRARLRPRAILGFCSRTLPGEIARPEGLGELSVAVLVGVPLSELELEACFVSGSDNERLKSLSRILPSSAKRAWYVRRTSLVFERSLSRRCFA